MATLQYFADRLFKRSAFMLSEEYRGKPAVTVTFPNTEERNAFHTALVELSTYKTTDELPAPLTYETQTFEVTILPDKPRTWMAPAAYVFDDTAKTIWATICGLTVVQRSGSPTYKGNAMLRAEITALCRILSRSLGETKEYWEEKANELHNRKVEPK